MKVSPVTFQVTAPIEMKGVRGAPGRKLRKGEVLTLTIVREEPLAHIVQFRGTVYEIPTHALPWLRRLS